MAFGNSMRNRSLRDYPYDDLTISAASFLSDVAESCANFAVKALDRKDGKEPAKVLKKVLDWAESD